MRGTTYSTAESWFLTMTLNSGVLFSLGLASKFMFRLESPTVVQLLAAAVAAITPDSKKNPIRRHRIELFVPGLLGFACICLAPIVVTPGGNISWVLQLGCLLTCGIMSTIYVVTLQNLTKCAG